MVEIFEDKEKRGEWTIRNGMFRNNCVVDRLSEGNLLTIYKKIGKILSIPDFKKEMEADRDRFIGK